MNIGLIVIATGKYDQFVEPLLNSARIHFLPYENLTFFVFTDSKRDYGDDVVIIPTKAEAWPGPTINRYKYIMNSRSLFRQIDYLFYIDADMRFVDTVGKEILTEGLTGVLHPGFAMFPGKGSWDNNPLSTSYTHPSKRTAYYCGGFQFGKKHAFLSACALMAANIEADEKNGVIAEHNDETHFNKLLSETPHNTLVSSYCMVEEMSKRLLWKLTHLKPRIIALAKDHKTLRS